MKTRPISIHSRLCRKILSFLTNQKVNLQGVM